MSGQPSRASVPASNPAAAGQQQPRSGPIIVGVASSKATATKATTAAAPAVAAPSAPTIVGGKVKAEPVPGRGANESVAILGSYASSLEKGGKKRQASDCIDVLERSVPALFFRGCEREDAEGRKGKLSKKARGEGGSGDGDKDDGDRDSRGDNKQGEDGEERSGDIPDNAESDDLENRRRHQTQLQAELKHQKLQNQLLLKRRNDVLKRMVALHEMYETGLDGIARMNDLRYVPDNVLPEKIPRK